jgi:predicted dehydrogenase
MKINNIRLGVIGLGNMGRVHANSVLEGKVANLQLTAVADRNDNRLHNFEAVRTFNDGDTLIKSGLVDAVLIATPHYSHTYLGANALDAGLHVLVEKPISVHKEDCKRLIEHHRDTNQIFAAMFNQRTDPAYCKLRELIQSGQLGHIHRINWIVTDWYRTEHYYRTGDWRASWSGEGGGVLLNQCPHNLDLLQWLFGMPKRVTALCQLGRFHNIEVEDAVTALLEFDNGTTGVFVTSTGEAPGTNRLEVAIDRGKIVIENGKFLFTRTEQSVAEHCRLSNDGFSKPPVWEIEIPIVGKGEQHLGILSNFAAAIGGLEPLIAPAAEGIHSVELANAMLLSSVIGQSIELPIDGNAYEAILKKKIEESTFIKGPAIESQPLDLTNSF